MAGPKAQGSQRSMERAMLGVSLRDRFDRNDVNDIANRISTLKWQWVCYISLRTDNRWGKRILEWRRRLYKRSVGRPQAM
jgi:hypothetical protein